jgi:hypothetical protein
MRTLAAFLLLCTWHAGICQFDAAEYLDLVDVSRSTHAADSSSTGRRGVSKAFTRCYRSPEMGLLNRWELWMREDGTAVISLRGTVQQRASWLENFFAAMLPATGMLRLNDSTTFEYRLSADPAAAVHAGWTLGLAHLAPDIIPRLDSLCRLAGTRRVLIFGHSQGGALACLLTSYLHYRRAAGLLPADLQWKTYASAAPKPGNQYYAYDYEDITRDGRGFTVVNTADWVPETPGSVQTFGDLRSGSPLKDAETLLGRQPWPASSVLRSVYRSLKRSPEKTTKRFQRNFGHRIHRQLRRHLPGFPEPAYAPSFYYARAGSPIVLVPDEAYRERFPERPGNYFTHHLFEPYVFLVKRRYPAK